MNINNMSYITKKREFRARLLRTVSSVLTADPGIAISNPSSATHCFRPNYCIVRLGFLKILESL